MSAAESCGDRATVAQALEILDWTDMALGTLDGKPRAIRALAIYTELGDLGAAARALNGLGAREYFCGRWTEAAQHYERARAGFERIGDVANVATTAANLAEILVEQGRLAEAENNLSAARRVWQGVGAVSDLAWARYQQGRIAVRAGRPDEALEHFANARTHFDSHHEPLQVLLVDAATAECQVLAGQWSEALALSDQTLRRAASTAALAAAVPALHRTRGLALLQRPDRIGAETALRDSLTTARARAARHDIALTLTALVDHGFGGDQRAGWIEERDRLVTELGIVSLPPVGT